MVTVGEVCLILSRKNALLVFETRLWRLDKVGQNHACVRASADAKHASKEGHVCMLMAPGPSG